MTLSDLAAIGSFLSGLAVVFSFVFLALQLRQSNKNQRAMMQQGRAARTSETMLRVAEPHMLECMMRGGEGDMTMTPVQIESFVRATLAMLVNWEDTFLQHSAGTIDASGMASDAAMMHVIFAIPGYRAVWATVQRQFSGRFRDYVDGLMREHKSQAPRRDVTTAWKAHMVEELSGAPAGQEGR